MAFMQNLGGSKPGKRGSPSGARTESAEGEAPGPKSRFPGTRSKHLGKNRAIRKALPRGFGSR